MLKAGSGLGTRLLPTDKKEKPLRCQPQAKEVGMACIATTCKLDDPLPCLEFADPLPRSYTLL